jgi:hypothetical protein
MDKLEEIYNILSIIEKEHNEKMRIAGNNRNACIEKIHFITETINAIAPGQIRATWYGSFTNSGVAEYPVLTIQACHHRPHSILATWRIDAGGNAAAPNITKEDILTEVKEGLKKLRMYSNW